MKKIIFLIVAVILFALAIIGRLAMFDHRSFANLLKGTKKVETEQPAPPPPPADKVFDLGTYIIPLVEGRAIRRQVGMDLNIVVDPSAAAKVSSEMPRLQNVLLRDLYDFVPTHADTHSEANKEIVHQHLIKVTNGFVGDNKVRDVVIKSFYDR